MKIEHIWTFLEVANCGNFNRAAELLNVTQSTVSARIKSLEDWFGHALFARSHAGVELTAAGRHFRGYAVNMQRLWLQANQRVSLPESFNRSFGLGAQVSLMDRLVLHWIPWMRENASDVALYVASDYSVSLMRQLVDGVLDIGVMFQPRQTAGLVIEELLSDTLVLVATKQREVSEQWVEDYVYVDWGEAFREQHGLAYPQAQTPALSVGHGALGLEYILQNGGSGYFPMRLVQPYLDRRELHLVTGAPSMQRPAYVVFPAEPRHAESTELALMGLREIAENSAT